MAIRVDAYTSGGMASGTLARPGALRDALEDDGELPSTAPPGRASTIRTPSPPGALSIPSDDILVAVADDDPGRPGPRRPGTTSISNRARTRVEGELATLPGFDPGRALTRPSGEFLLLRDVRLSVRDRPEAGVAVGDHALVNRYAVERIRADLMLGFFFPGAAVDPIGRSGVGAVPDTVRSPAAPAAEPAGRPAVSGRCSRRPPGAGPACDARGAPALTRA